MGEIYMPRGGSGGSTTKAKTFWINSTAYLFTEGMTFSEWVKTHNQYSINTGGYVVSSSSLGSYLKEKDSDAYVRGTSPIKEINYVTTNKAPGGDVV